MEYKKIDSKELNQQIQSGFLSKSVIVDIRSSNTMVYGPGGYRFLDFTRVGAPLSLLLTIVTPWLITQIYGL